MKNSKSKISELKKLTLDQEKFNSIISQIITDMSLDENIDDEEKKKKKIIKKTNNQSLKIKIKNQKKKRKNMKKCH